MFAPRFALPARACLALGSGGCRQPGRQQQGANTSAGDAAEVVTRKSSGCGVGRQGSEMLQGETPRVNGCQNFDFRL